MLQASLHEAGGVAYLVRQAEANPAAYMSLVGKIIPQQIDATIRRELPMMTRDELLALLDSTKAIAQRPRVIEHEPVPQQARDMPKKRK